MQNKTHLKCSCNTLGRRKLAISKPPISMTLTASAKTKWMRAGFVTLLLIALVGFVSAQRHLVRAITALNRAQAPVVWAAQASSVPTRALDAFAALPATMDGDAVMRLASKIASEQKQTLVNMQAEFRTAVAGHLAQRKTTLQLRGDYASTKQVLISLLARFPGLALEHLTIRHLPNGKQSSPLDDPMSGAVDETTIELIQYSRPHQEDL